MIAVKPQDLNALLDEIAPALDGSQTVLSLAAAIPDRVDRARDCTARSRSSGRCRTHRRPCTKGSRASAAAGRPPLEHLELASQVLRAVGDVVVLPEDAMDAVTAVSGSGPAYYALLAEAMIEAGILLGLSREVSTRLVVQTMFGTAKLLRDEKMHPVELREAVTSPGGTTTRAIRELEQAGVRAAFLNAINAAMERSRELAAGSD